jgi:alpha-beta hydrolase superfamily lysophospholipase
VRANHKDKASGARHGHRRRRALRACGAVVGVLAVGLVVWYAALSSNGELPAAAASPFYAVTSSLPAGHPGAILRSQPIIRGVPAGARAWRVLHTSTAFDTGRPIAVSAVVFAPAGGPIPAGGRAVIAWAHPTTGITSTCAPSLLAGGGASTIPGLQSFLQDGYVVVATDYPGLGTQGPAPYLVGSSEARAVLDSIRAARQLPGANAGSHFILWGHSQGGQAALFAGQLAQSYAPELKLQGVAVAAPATDLARLLSLDLPTIAGKVLGSMALESWSKVYPGVSLRQLMSARTIPLLEDIGRSCLQNKSSALAALPAAAMLRLTGSLSATPLLSHPAWARILKQNTPVAAAADDVPVLITQGTADPIVRPQISAAFAQALCHRHLRVEYQLLKNVGHNAAGFDSAPAVVLWAQDRFNRVAPPSNCAG